MKNLSKVAYHPVVQKLSEILCERTRSDDPGFFRIMASYYIVKVASMMRCSVATPDRGKIPVSMYAINLAASGHGKGHSMNIFEDSVLNAFRKRFLKRYKSDKPPSTRKIISVEEMSLLLNSIVSLRDKTIAVLLAKTGIRRSELVAIELSDINFDEGSVLLKFFKKEFQLKSGVGYHPVCTGASCKKA